MSHIKAEPGESRANLTTGRKDLEGGLSELFTSTIRSDAALSKLRQVFPNKGFNESSARDILSSVADVCIQNVLSNLDAWLSRHNISHLVNDSSVARDVAGHSLGAIPAAELSEATGDTLPDVELPRRMLQDVSAVAHEVHLEKLQQCVREKRQESDKIKQAIDANIAQIRDLCDQLSTDRFALSTHQSNSP